MLVGQRHQVDIFRFFVKSSIELDREASINGAISRFTFFCIELLDIMWEENWKHIQQNMKPLDFLVEYTIVSAPGDRAALVLQWLIDHGAGVPGDVWRYLMH
jgi:hypothetical protein